MKRGCLMPDQSTPEIDRLNEIAHRPDKRSVTQWTPLVALPDAIQAVRDTEANLIARLASELLNDEAMAAAWCAWASTDEDRNEDAWSGAVAAFIDRTFLSPDNPEGNA